MKATPIMPDAALADVPAPAGVVQALRWEAKRLYLLDQRALPQRCEYVPANTAQEVAAHITAMVVRGAPAIGIAAAYGIALAAIREADMGQAFAALAQSRPTAVNLQWALSRMRQRWEQGADADELTAEAQAIHAEDAAMNRRMGELGASLFDTPVRVLTHCNTGALATGGHGTALGVIRSAHALGRLAAVYAGETRPWLQGARLTAWELQQEGIAARLIADSAAASLMAAGALDWVIVGADRVVANGDVANKIGTYALAVLARHHGLKFMVVAPSTSLDMALASGADIPIETRADSELTMLAGEPVAPSGQATWNPVFDVTPADLVDVLVTELGIVRNPGPDTLRQLLGKIS